ncbi:HalOD1 output domain-containing protein [Natronoarchaeum rubrum]|uniref:HalOD1 output domain-containing protein n=1 Tax=Natronoarchaeum rubrum TaxID=755311 RepID=UPI0021120E52|nr:HalOD1 output domain-containing protein [Natronoarchaeum rubrum]
MNGPARETSGGSALLACSVDDDESTSAAVVRAVAAISNTAATRLPPLYETVDPDTLDGLFPPEATGGELRFDYAGYAVVVSSTGTIELHETTDSPLSA